MSNAAIYLHPDAFDTSGPQLMGRHSAGEGFLRGFIKHAEVDRLHLWNAGRDTEAVMDAAVRRVQPTHKPITWYRRGERQRLGEPGVVSLPSPAIAEQAWLRGSVGDHVYGVCGITHTTATSRVSDALIDMVTAPVHPWDALVCTSRAVRVSVATQLELALDHLEERLGITKRPEIRLETIPLGVDTEAFAPSPEARRAWRAELDIPHDAVVVLYMGRFNLLSKMNPVPMAIALEAAARASGRPLYWLVSGWAASEAKAAEYHEISRAACPSVHYRVVDGRRPEARFSIWSAADIFLSLSDNVQETFGLTPVEAMAAGLPSIISDWDGYRDTVRHRQDGFRIRTTAPRPGLGEDLAYRHAAAWDSYDGYVGAVSQFTAVDIGVTIQALEVLIADPGLRRRMGASARARAVETFDWSRVIAQHQALWADMAALRPAEPMQRPRGAPANPWRLDPYRQFAGYPTRTMRPADRLGLAPGVTVAMVGELRSEPILKTVVGILPSRAELERVAEIVGAPSGATVAAVTGDFPVVRRFHIERSILLLAKYGLLVVTPDAQGIETPGRATP